ncbi:MAG: N-6 DNA methylase [Bacteroidales bacterium]|nr:N-6 DNA methylase [Bacteroidales bacterium]
MDFKVKYNKEAFISFFSDELLPEDFEINEESIELDFQSKYFQEITYLGECKSLNLNVYEIIHSSEKDARVSLSRDAFKLVSRYDKNNALVLFVPEDPTNYRLSLVTIEPRFDEKGIRVKREYSNPRRYSFVLGEDSKTHTPEQYLVNKGRISDIIDLKTRFSVEVVNKEFYNLIAEAFSKLVGGKRKRGNRTIEFQRQLRLPSVSSDNDQKYKEFAVRLIGRTVFCWFLKKKKSSNNRHLIPEEILSYFALNFTSNYYHSVIEPLFFEVLNTPLDERNDKYQKEPYKSIPFLNGGLFEPHLDDFYKLNTTTYISEYINTLKIPDDWWKDFITILERYNFTIDENTSVDIDLSVDPEMLGRIFENLLAEINPETDKSAQKATGSFYTPREVVDYMVDMSLISYLSEQTHLDEVILRKLLDVSNDESLVNPTETVSIITALSKLKILDPACGSGAFPMSFLHRMLIILEKIDPNSQKWFEKQLEKVPDLLRNDFRNSLKDKTIAYKHKLGIIKESVYGIDIQPIAVEISKLRFFLSLIVDEIIIDDEPNRGIQPLPNLEFKFVCANSIIAIPSDEYIENKAESSLKNIALLSEKYFSEYHKLLKHDIISDIERNVDEIISWNLNVINQYVAQINKERNQSTSSRIKTLENKQKSYIRALNKWETFKNLFNNQPIDFFSIKYLFPDVKDNFDIVIGNPPYGVSVKGDYRTDVVEYLGAVPDYEIYYFFIEVAKKLLKKSGILSYIVPNTLLFNVFAKKYRISLFESWSINEILDCTEFDLFENATIRNLIFQFKYDTSNKLVGYRNTQNITTFNEFLSRPLLFVDKDILLKSNQNWGLAFKLEKEITDVVNIIKSNSIPLNSNFDVSQGYIPYRKSDLIKIYGKTKAKEIVEKRLWHSDVRINKEYKQEIFGRNISKYDYDKFESYVWYGKHLACYVDLRFFNQKRILVREITNPNIIACIIEEELVNDPQLICVIPKEEKSIHLEFLWVILNSRIGTFYHFNSSPKATKGAFPKVLVEDVNNFPIPSVNPETEQKVTDMAIRLMQHAIDNPTSIKNPAWESLLDIIVLKMYNLSYKQSKLIFSNIQFYIKESDYEKYTINELVDSYSKQIKS